MNPELATSKPLDGAEPAARFLEIGEVPANVQQPRPEAPPLPVRNAIPVLTTIAFASFCAWGLAQLDVVTFEGMLEYLHEAGVLRHGGLLDYSHAVHPFGYPGLLVVIELLTPSLFTAGKLVSWVAGVAVLAMLTALARRAFGEPEARWASVAAILGSALAAHTLEPSSTLPAAALQLASLAAVVSALERPRRLIAAGALVGAAWLMRYPSLLVFLATLVWLVIHHRREPRRCLAALAWYALPFFAMASPQLVLNLRHGVDPFIASNAGYILRVERGGFATGQTIPSMMLLEGGRAAAFWAKNLALFVAFHAPLLIAMVAVLRRDLRPAVVYLATVVVVQQLVLALTNFNPKFYLLDRWLLLGFALRALTLHAPELRTAWYARRARGPGAFARAAVTGVLATAGALLLVSYLAFRIVEVRSMLGRDELGDAQRAITALLYGNGYTRVSEVLGCSSVHYDRRALERDQVVYYRDGSAQLGSVPRFSSGAALVRFMREHAFRFVLYDDEERARCPDMAFLFQPVAVPDSLVPLWIDDWFNQTDRLALYQLEDEPAVPLTAHQRVARFRAARRPSFLGVLQDWADALEGSHAERHAS